jgi:hypothetical protein
MVLVASIAALLSAQPALHVREDVAPVLVRHHEPTLRRRHGVWYRVRKTKPQAVRAPEPPRPAVIVEPTDYWTRPIALPTVHVQSETIYSTNTFAERWEALLR